MDCHRAYTKSTRSILIQRQSVALGPFSGEKIFCHPAHLESWLKDGITHAPVTLEIDVTNVCNAKCPSCAGGRGNPHASWDESGYDLFAQMVDAGVKAVIFTGGGEPTLHPLLPRYIYRAWQEGLEVALISNGIILPDAVADVARACCTWVRFSSAPDPESWTAQTGMPEFTYYKALENIARFASHRGLPTVGVGCLTDTSTASRLDIMVRLARELRVDYVQFRPMHHDRTSVSREVLERLQGVFPSVRVLASWHKYEGMGKPRRYTVCYGHYFTGVVQADYTMTVCCHTRGMRRYSWGNALDGFSPAWHSNGHLAAVSHINLDTCIPLCRCDHFNQALWIIKDMKTPYLHLDPVEDKIEHHCFL